MGEKINEEDLKGLIYAKVTNVNFKDKKGVVTLIKEQNHPIQKFFRKLHFKIPSNTYLELDAYGSFVFQNIDGKKSIFEIGQMLKEKYPESGNLLYSRLLVYLNVLENNEKVIERVVKND